MTAFSVSSTFFVIAAVVFLLKTKRVKMSSLVVGVILGATLMSNTTEGPRLWNDIQGKASDVWAAVIPGGK